MMLSKNRDLIGQLSTYILLLVLMGAKAIGLEEGQWPFTVALCIALLCFGIKLIATRWNYLEIIVIVLLISLGITIYYKSGKPDFFFMLVMVIVMKNMLLDRTAKFVLLTWGILFVFTIIRSLVGIYPGYIGIQRKAVIDMVLVRYSLGYSHPNVLHIVYLVIILLILYVMEREKITWKVYIALMMGNLYVFMYSLSYTGILVTTFAIMLDIYASRRKIMGTHEKLFMVGFSIMCFLIPTLGATILPPGAVDVIDKVVNQRCGMTKRVFELMPPQLFGRNDAIQELNLNLDSSYAYMMFFGGYVFFILYFVGFIGCLINGLKNPKSGQMTVLIPMALSGITEQYMGNMSFKNISILFIGDYVFNYCTPKWNARLFNADIEFSPKEVLFKLNMDILGRYSECAKSNIKRLCTIGILFAVASVVLFKICWVEPKHFYLVTDREDIPTIEYTVDSNIDLEHNIVMGQIYEGCRIHDVDYANFEFDTLRGYISSAILGFAIGYIVTLILCYAFETKRRRCTNAGSD